MKTNELLKENVYRVTYKNGNQRDYKFYSMVKHGNNYLTLRQPWCGNPAPGVIPGEYIEKVECIERNNNIDFE